MLDTNSLVVGDPETDDSLDSIHPTSSSIVKYGQKAGIGIGAGSIRAIVQD